MRELHEFHGDGVLVEDLSKRIKAMRELHDVMFHGNALRLRKVV